MSFLSPSSADAKLQQVGGDGRHALTGESCRKGPTAGASFSVKFLAATHSHDTQPTRSRGLPVQFIIFDNFDLLLLKDTARLTTNRPFKHQWSQPILIFYTLKEAARQHSQIPWSMDESDLIAFHHHPLNSQPGVLQAFTLHRKHIVDDIPLMLMMMLNGIQTNKRTRMTGKECSSKIGKTIPIPKETRSK